MNADTATTPATLLDAVSMADQAIAPPPATPVEPKAAEAAPTTRFVQFTVASTCYAVAQTLVTELRRVPAITLVPQTPSWLRGVANVRGDVLSVVDLRAFLGLEATSPHTGRMLIVRLLDQDFSAGLLVDGIDRIVTLDRDAIRPPASPLEGPLAPFLAGVCVADERLVAVLDLGRLLRSPDIRQFEDRKEDSSCEGR
jgi:purine-binding chemotaxis protein CheW